MALIRVYPAGVVLMERYTREMKSDDTLVITRPDAEIIELYKKRLGTHLRIESFEFKKQLISIALRLYGSFYPWIAYQLRQNKFVHDNNQDFLIDTLRFIKTGERQAHLAVWEGILDSYPDTVNKKDPINDMVINQFIDSPYEEASSFISEWTSQKGGWYDLLYTTYLLFGKADDISLKKVNLLN